MFRADPNGNRNMVTYHRRMSQLSISEVAREVRELFFGFASGTRAPARWRKLSQRKLVQLEASIDRIKTMQRLLIRLQQRCHCDTLDECGKRRLKTN